MQLSPLMRPIIFARGLQSIKSVVSVEDKEIIQKWLDNLRISSIPRDKFGLKFSRSSGPGGQNVNKVNTKADIRLKVADATWIPLKLRQTLSELYGNSITQDGELVVQSMRHRTQSENIQDGFEKILKMLKHAGIVALGPAEPSLAQQQHVAALQKSAALAQAHHKQKRSQCKTSRMRTKDFE